MVETGVPGLRAPDPVSAASAGTFEWMPARRSGFAAFRGRLLLAFALVVGIVVATVVGTNVLVEAKLASVKRVDLRVDGRALAITPVSMGNPHAVHFQQAPVEDFPLETLGPLVEHHGLFPNRANFEVVRGTLIEYNNDSKSLLKQHMRKTWF